MGTQTEPGSAFYYGYVERQYSYINNADSYSGNHMQVLGYMAENKTGIDWKTLFSTYLTEPLGMVARYGGNSNPRMAGMYLIDFSILLPIVVSGKYSDNFRSNFLLFNIM
jgi:CubicO group peptidase (beta-lactamase class C family)